MFGEVELGEADYTAVWDTLLFMSNILCQISLYMPFEAYSLLRLFAVGKYENIHHKCFLRIWQNPGLMLMNMFNRTFAPNLVT